MAEQKQSSRRWWIGLVALIVVVFAVWMIAGDSLWRRPDAVSDSRDAAVQPATVPAPDTPEMTTPMQGDLTGDAARGQSAVRGDGQAVNR